MHGNDEPLEGHHHRLTTDVAEVGFLTGVPEHAGGGSVVTVELRRIGRVESPLLDPDLAPKQGDEGAPDAWLVFERSVRAALADLRTGAEIIVLTWLHRADRDVLEVHPRDDPDRPVCGVFATRSQDRPNPIGLHTTRIIEIVDLRIRVQNLEALDQTPILDVKPVLGTVVER